jgi:hypothetical protein
VLVGHLRKSFGRSWGAGFSGDGVTRISEGCDWCKHLEHGWLLLCGRLGAMALWLEFTFVMGLAREEVITILVKGSSTNACCSDEGRGKRLGGKGDRGGRVAR